MAIDSYLETDKLLILIIASVTGIFIMILSVHLLYHLFFKLHGLNKAMKILCTLFAIAYIPMTISNILTETEPEHTRPTHLIIMNASYFAINVTLYLIIFLRYFDTFNKTIYQSSNRTYIFILSSITIYFLAYTTWFIAYANRLFQDKLRSTQIVIIAEAIMLIDDIILSFTITYLFCKNLFKLTVSMSSMSIDRDYDIKPPNNKQTRSTKTLDFPDDEDETIKEDTLWTATPTDTKIPYDEVSDYDKLNPNPSVFSPNLKSKKSSSILSLSIRTSLLLTTSTYYNKKTPDGHCVDPNDSPQKLELNPEDDDCDSDMTIGRRILTRSMRGNTFISTLDIKQQQLISVATRLMILTIPAVVTTTLVWGVSLVVWIALYQQNMNVYYPGRWILHVFVLPIDGIANFLCIYLNFKFSRGCYDKLCCGISRFCENCWAIVTELKLEQMKKEKRRQQLLI